MAAALAAARLHPARCRRRRFAATAAQTSRRPVAEADTPRVPDTAGAPDSRVALDREAEPGKAVAAPDREEPPAGVPDRAVARPHMTAAEEAAAYRPVSAAGEGARRTASVAVRQTEAAEEALRRRAEAVPVVEEERMPAAAPEEWLPLEPAFRKPCRTLSPAAPVHHMLRRISSLRSPP